MCGDHGHTRTHSFHWEMSSRIGNCAVQNAVMPGKAFHMSGDGGFVKSVCAGKANPYPE